MKTKNEYIFMVCLICETLITCKREKICKTCKQNKQLNCDAILQWEMNDDAHLCICSECYEHHKWLSVKTIKGGRDAT